MKTPQSHWFQSDGLRIHYLDWGNHTAPPLLLVHGGRDHSRNWDWVAEALKTNYHVMALDLRGHGDSDWGGPNAYSVMEYVYDLSQWVKHLQLDRLTIIGHSLGGAIALKYAGIYPEKIKRLVVIEGLGASPSQLEQLKMQGPAERFKRWETKIERRANSPKRYFASQAEAIARMQTVNSHLPSKVSEHLAIYGSRRTEDGLYRWKFDYRARDYPDIYLGDQESRELWRNIDCPVLLVRGANSWASDPLKDGRAAYFNDARVINIDSAGHWPHHDQLEEFMVALRSFL